MNEANSISNIDGTDYDTPPQGKAALAKIPEDNHPLNWETDTKFDLKELLGRAMRVDVSDDTPTEGPGTVPNSDKYIDERFKRVEERIEHQNDLFSSKIDRVVDKIDSMSESVTGLNSKIEKVEGKVDKFKSNIWWAVLTTVIGVGAIVGAILLGLAQMQQSWLQQYLNIIAKLPK